jgi:hypothetical protein
LTTEPDAARIAAVPATALLLVLPRVTGAGELPKFLREKILHVQQTQRDQRANQLDLGVQLQLGVLLTIDDFHLAEALLSLASLNRT